MARVLKLVRGATELNLLNDGGIHLRSGEDNWRPVYPVATVYGDPAPVVETMRLQCYGTSHDALAGTMQMWADMMQGAALYRQDANGTVPVWLHAKLDGETGERRSIVHQIDTAWVDSGISEVIDAGYMLFDAAIERGPYWEAPTPTAMGTMVYTNLLTNGGFETAGAGGADVFGTWVETAGDGAIARSTSSPLFGTAHAQLTAGATANTKVAQTVAVTAGHHYALVFHQSIDDPGDDPGRYGVYDVANGADIIPITAASSAYQYLTTAGPVVVPFTTPAGCNSIRIDLWCPASNTDVIFYDGVALFDLGYGPAVVYDYTANGGADVAGDVPARPWPLTLAQYASMDTASRPPFEMDKVWIAARSENKHPGLASFVPILYCRDATPGTSAAATADIYGTGYTGAAATNIIRVTPGSATWFERVGTTTDLGTANYGDFLWLLRSRVSAGTYEVKLRWETSAAQYLEGPVVSVTATSYSWHEMGVAQFPAYNRRAMGPTIYGETDANDNWSLAIWARRTAGTGVLDLDCVGMLPVDEGALVADGINLYAAWRDTANQVYMGYAQGPSGDVQAVTIDNQYRAVETPEAFGQLPIPVGDGRFIIFTNGTAVSSLTPFVGFQSGDTANLASSQYYKRWLSLRGAE